MLCPPPPVQPTGQAGRTRAHPNTGQFRLPPSPSPRGEGAWGAGSQGHPGSAGCSGRAPQLQAAPCTPAAPLPPLPCPGKAESTHKQGGCLEWGTQGPSPHLLPPPGPRDKSPSEPRPGQAVWAPAPPALGLERKGGLRVSQTQQPPGQPPAPRAPTLQPCRVPPPPIHTAETQAPASGDPAGTESNEQPGTLPGQPASTATRHPPARPSRSPSARQRGGRTTWPVRAAAGEPGTGRRAGTPVGSFTEGRDPERAGVH